MNASILAHTEPASVAEYQKTSADYLKNEAAKGELKLLVNTFQGRLAVGVWLYDHIANFSFGDLLSHFTKGLDSASLRNGSQWCDSIATDLELAAQNLRGEAQRLRSLEQYGNRHSIRCKRSSRKTVPLLGEVPLSIGRAFEERDRRILRTEFRRADLTSLRFHIAQCISHLRAFVATVRSFINPEVN